MQNQDPTSDTDPNEYINQLVQVNSLEQLIDINQTLSTDAGSTSGTGASPKAVGAASNPAEFRYAGIIRCFAAHRRTTGRIAALDHDWRSGLQRICIRRRVSAQRISGNLSAPNAICCSATRWACAGWPNACGPGAGNFACEPISLFTRPAT